MTLYTCECNKTIVHRDGKWVTKEALCECGKYMDSEPTEGMPSLKRTEPSLTMKRDKLWEGATEKIRSKSE